MKEHRLWHNPVVRQAIQAGLAVGLSILLGSLISGRRWYWAAIAAFIVGTGVNSRGEALVKAFQRVGGTLAGIAVGMGLASAVSGHTDLALGLVLVCVFFSFYAFQAAYGVMIFGITLMLALLYGLLGQFQPSLLVLRVEETAIGAAVSVVITTLVLPLRQNEQFEDAARAFLDSMAETLDHLEAARRADADKAARTMQAKVQGMRNSVGLLKRGWGHLASSPRRFALRAAMRCAYLTRELSSAPEAETLDVQPILAAIAQVRQSLGSKKPPHDQETAPTPEGLVPESQSNQEESSSLADELLDAVRSFGQRMRDA